MSFYSILAFFFTKNANYTILNSSTHKFVRKWMLVTGIIIWLLVRWYCTGPYIIRWRLLVCRGTVPTVLWQSMFDVWCSHHLRKFVIETGGEAEETQMLHDTIIPWPGSPGQFFHHSKWCTKCRAMTTLVQRILSTFADCLRKLWVIAFNYLQPHVGYFVYLSFSCCFSAWCVYWLFFHSDLMMFP